MGHEHVEDRLVYKQVPMLDDEALTIDPQWKKTPLDWDREARDIFGNVRKWEKHIRELFRLTGHVNRSRRNFRLIRDWNNGRPWWVLFHTSIDDHYLSQGRMKDRVATDSLS